MSQNKVELKRTICPLDCPDSCGMIAKVEQGRVIGLFGDKEHPNTRGVICRKMKSYHKRLYSKDRLSYPMKRVGIKGSARFERISWDEAYQLLTDKIVAITKNYGGEAILPFVYAGNMGAVNRFAGYPLFHKLGTSRLDETICSTAAKAGWKCHCGDISGSPPEIAAEAKLILIWGSNTKVTNMHFWPYAVKARKNGAKIVVIDPYRNITAASADIHAKIQPGQDASLALGLLKLLIENNGIDSKFISEATSGFEVLAKYLLKTPLSMLSSRCGIDIELMEELAELLGSQQKIFMRLGIGMTRNSRAAMSLRAITSLAAGLGLFDGGAGRGVLLTSGAFKGDQEKLAWASLAKGNTRKFNMVQLGNALSSADPPIKMLMVYNANPLSVVPDGSLVRRAMASEDLYTVVHEQVMTPTAAYADLLLPATTFLENKDVYTAYGHFYMGVAEPAIDPLGEAKSNFTFFQELAQKLGFTDTPFQQSIDDRIVNYLNSLEGLPEDVQADNLPNGQAILSTRCRKGTPLFGESVGKFNFLQHSDPGQPLHACSLDAGEFDDADYIARFPLKLITPPHLNLLNSTFGERYAGESGEVLIHPDDARRYNIKPGDRVTLSNNRGSTCRVANLSEATSEGLLVAEGIFWQHMMNPTGINDVTSQKLTDMGGGGTYHESRVAIKSTKS